MANTIVVAETTGGVAQFDVDDLDGVGPERVSRRGGIAVAALDSSFDDVLAAARPAAEAVIDAFRQISPGEIAVEFGLRIDAQAGAVFAKAGVGAHFKVNLRWTPSAAPGDVTTGTVAATPETSPGGSDDESAHSSHADT